MRWNSGENIADLCMCCVWSCKSVCILHISGDGFLPAAMQSISGMSRLNFWDSTWGKAEWEREEQKDTKMQIWCSPYIRELLETDVVSIFTEYWSSGCRGFSFWKCIFLIIVGLFCCMNTRWMTLEVKSWPRDLASVVIDIQCTYPVSI